MFRIKIISHIVQWMIKLHFENILIFPHFLDISSSAIGVGKEQMSTSAYKNLWLLQKAIWGKYVYKMQYKTEKFDTTVCFSLSTKSRILLIQVIQKASLSLHLHLFSFSFYRSSHYRSVSNDYIITTYSLITSLSHF